MLIVFLHKSLGDTLYGHMPYISSNFFTLFNGENLEMVEKYKIFSALEDVETTVDYGE